MLCLTEAVVQGCSIKKVLKNFANHHRKYLFIKGHFLMKVFSCEYCELYTNSFFIEYLWVAAPRLNIIILFLYFLSHRKKLLKAAGRNMKYFTGRKFSRILFHKNNRGLI